LPVKPVTRYTSNEFHDWQRRALPSNVVIQDVDAWALAVSDPADDYRPVALIELKRTSVAKLRDWRPFDADRRNFASLVALADAAVIPLYVVAFAAHVTITDETTLHVFRLDAADPAYCGRHGLMTARRFAEKFPYPISPL